MKATLEFNLPEDAELHRIHTHAQELYSTLREIDEYCRRTEKHNPDVTRDAVIETVRSLCNETMWKVE